jgi:hypothetical protein
MIGPSCLDAGLATTDAGEAVLSQDYVKIALCVASVTDGEELWGGRLVDTKPCTFSPDVHGFVSFSAILPPLAGGSSVLERAGTSRIT